MDILKTKLNDLEYKNDYTHKLLEAENHFNNIYKVCGNETRYGCGSYLISATEYKYCIHNYRKQKLLFDMTIYFINSEIRMFLIRQI